MDVLSCAVPISENDFVVPENIAVWLIRNGVCIRGHLSVEVNRICMDDAPVPSAYFF